MEKDGRIQNWFGGLVDGMRDASGQMYMRNRYYPPRHRMLMGLETPQNAGNIFQPVYPGRGVQR